MDDARAQHDQLFKRLLNLFFAEFMQAFFPEASRLIDFQEVHFEPEVVYTDTPLGERRQIDVLVKTRLIGEDGMVLVHVEPQAQYQRTFNERMFLYFSYLYHKYRLRILPVALFTYDEEREEPDNFEIGFEFLDVLRFRFYKLEPKKLNWRDYVKADNPAVGALMSKMCYTKEEKVQVKIEFVRMLARMRLDPARISFLINFFEYYLKLNEHEEELFRREMGKLDKGEAAVIMQVATWEEELQIKAEVKHARKTINRLLDSKFGNTPIGIQEKIGQIDDLTILDEVLERLFTADSLEKARAVIEEALDN